VELSVPVKDYRSTLLFFRHRWPLNPVCYFYRRAVQLAVGEFPLDEHNAMDYWFLVRAMMGAQIHGSDLVFGTYFSPPESKTARASGVSGQQRTMRRLCDLVRQHLRENDPELLPWWNAHWLFHRWVRESPERVKAPLRYLAYKALFSDILDYHEYQDLGFRRAYRKRFPHP
jgi:hypothetical protein